jgi:aminoglycoside phosphotransferase
VPLPIAAEALEDARRVVGRTALLRLAWDIGEGSAVFQVLSNGSVAAYLKVAPDLLAERERLDWLGGRLPVSRVLSHGRSESTEWLLIAPLPGLDLTNLKHTEPPTQIVSLLADALRLIHETPADDCPFGERLPGAVLTHGDACLPNFLFSDGRLTGVVDVGKCGLYDPAFDLATAVWSVQHNLGPGHARAFLDAYGIDLEDNQLELILDGDGNESLRRVGESSTY